MNWLPLRAMGGMTDGAAAAMAAFGYYFPAEPANGPWAIAATAMAALAGGALLIRSRWRAAQSDQRREEMERLHQLALALLAANTAVETARCVVAEAGALFGANKVILQLDDIAESFSYTAAAGSPNAPQAVSTVHLREPAPAGFLEIHGPALSTELRSALATLIGVALERARTSEERTRLETVKAGEELRANILSSLAHGFRTPLTSIKAAASMLRGSAEMASLNGRELVEVIDEEADRLDRMIAESLVPGRIESYRVNPRNEVCSVAALVNSAAERMLRYLGGRKLILDIAPGLPIIHGDPFLLEQMLVQVVDNAWKYSLPGALIRIGAEKSEGNVLITVFNEGVPIPRDETERIFGKFYRGVVSRSQVEGAGLGLAIAKSIVEAHGGTIALVPDPLGPAFRFSLPARH